MIALPPALGGTTTLTAWRIDDEAYRRSWVQGEGARLYGGRWNTVGTAAVYLSLEPSTAILEVAVHKGIATLARRAHVMTAVEVPNPAEVHVVQPETVPQSSWLQPGWPSPEQQAYGADLLTTHSFVLWPSTVSPYSWNLVWNPAIAAGRYSVTRQETLIFDPRLRNPP